MASHLFWANAVGILAPVVYLAQFGARGVDLFFALSGFLITGILFDSLHDPRYFRNFYARRTLRIFPLYYLAVFLCLILGHWLGPQDHTHWVYLFYLQNTPAAGPEYQINMGPYLTLDHFWSLAVEEQFYLVWPLLVYFIRDRKRLLSLSLQLSAFAFALRLFLAFRHVPYHVINRSTITRMDSLLIGGALALLLREERSYKAVLDNALRVLLGVTIALAGLNLSIWLLENHPAAHQTMVNLDLGFHYILMAIGSAALIACCLKPTSWLRTLFESPVLRFFGKYSYGLYVIHFIFQAPLTHFFRSSIARWTSNKAIVIGGSGVAIVLLSTLAAYLCYQFYEKPFLRLKRYFDYGEPILAAEHRTDSIGR